MKIISVSRLTPTIEIDIHPDSTLILPGRPFFLPEDGEKRVARARMAVRISRLGKNISKKFAPRYYDGVTVGLRLTPPGEIPEEMKGVVSGMDSSTVVGEWLEPSSVRDAIEVKVGAECACVENVLPDIDVAIHEISRYMTLKMGDVLLLPEIMATPELAPSSRLSASLGTVEVLDLKIV